VRCSRHALPTQVAPLTVQQPHAPQPYLLYPPPRPHLTPLHPPRVRRHLQRQVVRPTAAFPSSSTQPVTPADAFALVNALTTVPEPDVPNTSSSSSSGRRRLLAQRLRRQRSPYLGAVVQVSLMACRFDLCPSLEYSKSLLHYMLACLPTCLLAY
jgi:hypothetical protein